MAIRVHELHPTLAHFPLALVPTSLALDVVGRLIGSEALMEAGRRLMPIAAVSTFATGLAGLVAQQAVRADGNAHAMLATHRNLNLLLAGVTAVLARTRWRSRQPGWGYLLAGLSGAAAMSYTAYLGGKMVYAHGVGVERAAGVWLDESPEIRRGSAARAARLSASHAARAVQQAAREFGEGEVAPLLQTGARRMQERRRRGDGMRREEPEAVGGYAEDVYRARGTEHSVPPPDAPL